MVLEGPLSEGPRGGHGPIRYHVIAYEPGRRARFAFDGPRGFDGFHEFVLEPQGPGTTLRHSLWMDASLPARLKWRLYLRPLHDALIEDALSKVERDVTGSSAVRAHSAAVRVLRWLTRAGRRLRRRLRSRTVSGGRRSESAGRGT